MEKLTKKDLKSPDAFISNMQRFGHWAFVNRMIILGGLGIITLAAVVWAGIGTYRTLRESKAQELLFNAEKKLKTQEEAFNPTPEPPPEAGAKSPPPKAPTATKSGDLATDYKEVVPAFKDVITQFGDTQASVIAALNLAQLFHDYKKYDDEIPFLEKAATNATHPVTKAMAVDNLGMAYEAKGDCNSAITQWQKIQNDKAMTAFVGVSLIKTALCYEKLNQNDKALNTYRRFDEAEKEIKKFTDAMAVEYHVNPSLPPEHQSRKDIEKFQEALRKSPRYRELESLISDRQAMKAAKKYLKLMKRGQPS